MFQKIEKFVFLALIFSIPFQKRTFLFGPAPTGENFFEWGSGFFYFTDFLLLGLVVLTVMKFFRTPEQLKRPFHPVGWSGLGLSGYLLVFLGISFVSLTQADLINVGVYRLTKLAEFIFLFFYTASFVGRRLRPSAAFGEGGMDRIRQLLWAFVASGIFQSIIAILQFAKQSSLGLEIFHESTLAIHMKGVAHVAADGLFLIRAYGTFPSPNVLAGFLGLCILFLFYLYLSRAGLGNIVAETFASKVSSLALSSARSPVTQSMAGAMPARLRVLFSNGILKTSRIRYGILLFLLTFALILTFSRGTLMFFALVSVLFFAGMCLLKQFERYRKQVKTLAVLVTVSWLLVIALAWPEVSARFLGSSFDEPAIQERLFFNEIGLDAIKHDYMHALFGVGIGNFVHNFTQSEPGLPDYLYQPVHNIFILIASETGTLGFFAFVLCVALLFEKFVRFFVNVNLCSIQDACYSKHLVYYTLAIVFCFLVLISMYDHYFWTIQQGGLMFWMVLGLIASKVNGQV